jgi:hypothetical protein
LQENLALSSFVFQKTSAESSAPLLSFQHLVPQWNPGECELRDPHFSLLILNFSFQMSYSAYFLPYLFVEPLRPAKKATRFQQVVQVCPFWGVCCPFLLNDIRYDVRITVQAKTSFFVAMFFILFLQTIAASRVLGDADAGPDQTVNDGDTVYLDGSGSTPEDEIQSYLWEQVKGKPKVALTGADQPIASFIAPQVSRDRRLTFKLTIRFASGSKDTDETKVKILDKKNDPPTADAGPDQTVFEQSTVTLDGSNSSDPDDGIESYLWKQIAGPSVSLSDPQAVQPTFTTPSVTGNKSLSLKFELTVTDFGGLKDADTTVVNVTGGNDPPTADAGPDQNVDEETKVTLDGSNSSDPDDGIASYQWKQITGPSVSLSNPQAVQPTFLAPNVGTDGVSFIFELTVTDFSSLQSTDTTIVNVIWLNDPPIANAGVDQTVLEKSTVTLDGSNSSDPDDGIASYQWKQLEGQSVTLSDPTDYQPTFEAPGVDDSGDKPLIFELIVTDEGGLQSSDSTSVSVSNFQKDNPGGASGGGCFIDTAAYGFLVAQ